MSTNSNVLFIHSFIQKSSTDVGGTVEEKNGLSRHIDPILASYLFVIFVRIKSYDLSQFYNYTYNLIQNYLLSSYVLIFHVNYMYRAVKRFSFLIITFTP